MFVNVSVKYGLFICLLLVSVEIGYTQHISVKTTIDTNRIILGDQIGLAYIIEADEDAIVLLPFFTKELVEGIEIIHEPVIDSIKMDDGNWKISLNLIITSFDTGIYYIPPQKFVIKDNTDTVLSAASYLEVFGVSIDTTNTVRDIKPPARMPVTFWEIFIYTISIILLAVLVYFIILYFQKRKRNESFLVPAKPEEPPHITAFRELDKIKTRKLWQQKQIKEYYSRITYVIRWYIFKRFKIHALEETSEEILYYIKSLGLDDINLKNLENLLNLADLVKFAKGDPNSEDNIIHLDNAYDFINITKQEEMESKVKNKDIDNKV